MLLKIAEKRKKTNMHKIERPLRTILFDTSVSLSGHILVYSSVVSQTVHKDCETISLVYCYLARCLGKHGTY